MLSRISESFTACFPTVRRPPAPTVSQSNQPTVNQSPSTSGSVAFDAEPAAGAAVAGSLSSAALTGSKAVTLARRPRQSVGRPCGARDPYALPAAADPNPAQVA